MQSLLVAIAVLSAPTLGQIGPHPPSAGPVVHESLSLAPARLAGRAPEHLKPKITIVCPATWECVHCPGHREQDWSGFEVTFVKDDRRAKFPCTEWTDSRGVVRRLYGKYTPKQVMWSYRKSGGA